MKLPYLQATKNPYQAEMVAMRGINYSDQIEDGDLRDSLNLSARRYPYITTRRARVKQEGYSGGTGLTAWGKLVAVQGTNLLYDGEIVGKVSAGEKQFAVVNTKMVIWPDKVYLDMTSREVKPLGAKLTGSKATFTTNSMKVSGWTDLTKLFNAGDAITLSGCTTQKENNKDFVIRSVTADTITVSDNTFKAASETSTAITLERKIPDMDFICESENRLWGCSNDAQTIFASSLGDPTNFYVYEGLATDSYALAVGSEGEFTGCCKLTSSVLFWKETKLHKMLGGYPAEYSLYTYDIEGLQKGCHKSLQVINEVLFYMGLHGVYAYSGGTPSLISANFGDHEFSDAVGGNDGDSYYLSVKDGDQRHFLVYETRSSIWVREDDTHVVDFARIGKDIYFLTKGGEVWLADGRTEDPNVEWLAQFTPFYEAIQGRKSYSKILLRLELPKGSYLQAEVRCDGGKWVRSGKVIGKEHDVVPMRIAVNRCDKFEIRLRGKGPCTILSMLREFRVRSDV